VLEPEEEAPPKTADVIDLAELLQRSLRGKGKSAPAKKKRAA
jgi:DNA end-binding protein Ku